MQGKAEGPKERKQEASEEASAEDRLRDAGYLYWSSTVETGVKEPIQHVLEMMLTRQVMS